MLFLFNIGFMPITIWDFLDVLIVGYLMFQIYKLLKGSLAFSIILGVAILFVVFWIVQALGMVLLSEILTQVIGVGLIAVVVIFQPEIRRFLLYLGRGTFARQSEFAFGLFNRGKSELNAEKVVKIRGILKAVEQLSATKTGALMVFTVNPNIQEFNDSGIVLDAEINEQILQSIFQKESPLHDGATIIAEGRIYAASCILPVSQNPDIPSWAGLRHRAAVGITEGTDVIALTVSEETGRISYAKEGRLRHDINLEKLEKVLRGVFEEFY